MEIVEALHLGICHEKKSWTIQIPNTRDTAITAPSIRIDWKFIGPDGWWTSVAPKGLN